MSIFTAHAVDCESCGRTIGKTAGHNVTDTYRVLCSRCLNTRNLHSLWWPNCPHTWHDNFDHIRYVLSTRGAVSRLLAGLR